MTLKKFKYPIYEMTHLVTGLMQSGKIIGLRKDGELLKYHDIIKYEKRKDLTDEEKFEFQTKSRENTEYLALEDTVLLQIENGAIKLKEVK
jgi:hypothetical protein